MQKRLDRESGLCEATSRLVDVVAEIKRLEKEKEALRQEFFDLANEEIETGRLLDRQLIEVPDGQNVVDFIEREHPGWRLYQTVEGSPMVVIEEDPAALKFSYVNPDNGMVFSRQIAHTDIKFDVEGFMAKYPELAESVVKMVPMLNEKKAEMVAENDPKTVPAFQEFTSRGKLQPRLSSRKATEDDLA